MNIDVKVDSFLVVASSHRRALQPPDPHPEEALCIQSHAFSIVR